MNTIYDAYTAVNRTNRFTVTSRAYDTARYVGTRPINTAEYRRYNISAQTYHTCVLHIQII